MNETRRTGTYVAVALVLGLLAWWASPPVEITPQELQAANIGKPFYPDFNAAEATSIRVAAFDEAKAEPRSFGVVFQGGKWTIPTRHNYPADGADRLAKTATSFKGIKREELAIGGDTEQSHETLGVVDPLDESKKSLKGHGQRITISKGEDSLVDLIIGKQLKDRSGFYYVRMPKENATYVAKLTLDLSTKFADWIETDLLKLNRDDLKEVVLDNSSIDEVRGRLIEGKIETLTRDKTADPWKLDGLDESKEELDTSKINTMLGALDDLKLVGVRPKPKGLRPDLTIDREYVKRQIDLDLLQRDLQLRGYVLTLDRNKELHLYSNEGELAAATNKGIVYTLKFGEVFSGDETEIEVGAGNEADDKKDGEKADKKDAKEKDKSKSDAGKQPSRYLFVTTHFDEKYLGPAPVKPERPEGLPADESEADEPQIKPKKSEKKAKPEPKPPTDEESSADDAPKTSDNFKEETQSAKPDDQCAPPSAEDGEPGSDADAQPEKKTTAEEPDAKKDNPKEDKESLNEDQKPGKTDPSSEDAGTEDAKKDPAAPKEKPAAVEKEKKPEELKKEYDAKLKKYKSDLKAHEEKIDAGKKQVDELNARFNDWYYVISAENFNKLHLTRKDLVKEKSKPAGDEKTKDKPSEKDPFPADSEKDPGDTEDSGNGDDDADKKDDKEKKKEPAAETGDKSKK